jgi:hypothetical protein
MDEAIHSLLTRWKSAWASMRGVDEFDCDLVLAQWTPREARQLHNFVAKL